MNTVNIKCKASEGAVIPEYKTSGAAGADLCALLEEPLTIPAGKFAMVPTGLFFEIPEGYEVQVRPRSGLAAKNGVTVLNTPGTIDSDYRGEIKVFLLISELLTLQLTMVTELPRWFLLQLHRPHLHFQKI